MDKKAIIVVSACVLLIIGNVYLSSKNRPAPSPAPTQTQTAAQTAPTPDSTQTPATVPNQQLSQAAATLVPEKDLPAEQIITLENNFFRVETTTHGGGIKQVQLKQHTIDGTRPVILNNSSQLPVFNIQGWTQEANLIGYQVANSDANSVTFTRELQPGITLSRKLTISGDYSITLEQTITNASNEIKVLPPYRLSIGSVSALHPENASAEERYVTLSWYTTAGNYSSGHLGQFNDTSFLGFRFWSGKKLIESPAGQPVRWAAVKSQFFTLIVNCSGNDAVEAEGQRQYFPDLRVEANAATPVGIAGDLSFSGITVSPGTSTAQKFTLYAGPKENSRLQLLPDNQAKVMEFGFVGWISRFLLWLMNFIHDYVGNYGIAVICVTIILRAILWYPQSAANRSMKRMQAVAPLIKDNQTKYKDKPDKLNAEMLKIYKDYGVNPVGGCLPMLIQFPIFIGFYWMLQSSIELRHEHFLWIKDLSQPDTIFRLPLGSFSLPINPMPLIMTVSMFISMHITPQPQGVDNPMVKMMKFMPFFFLIFCYNFSSALSLYWTAQNILSIIQMRYNLKQVAPTLEEMKVQAQARKKKQHKR
jgi:YidC/Oxa1 family membrane protein insertase